MGHPLFSPPAAEAATAQDATSDDSYLAEASVKSSTSPMVGVPVAGSVSPQSAGMLLSSMPTSEARLQPSTPVVKDPLHSAVEGKVLVSSAPVLHATSATVPSSSSTAGMPAASAIFLSPNEVLRQSYTLGQFVDTMNVPDGSLLSEVSDHSQMVAAHSAQHGFPSAYLDGDSLMWSSRDSLGSSCDSSLSERSSLPSGVYSTARSCLTTSEDRSGTRQDENGSLNESDDSNTVGDDDTLHSSSIVDAGIDHLEATPLQPQTALQQHPLATPHVDTIHSQRSPTDDSSAMLSLVITPRVDSDMKQVTDVVVRTTNGHNVTSAPGAVSHIEVSGLNFEKVAPVTSVRAQLDVQDEGVRASLRNEITEVQANVTCQDISLVSLSVPNDMAASASLSSAVDTNHKPATQSSLPGMTPPSARGDEPRLDHSLHTTTVGSIQGTVTEHSALSTPKRSGAGLSPSTGKPLSPGDVEQQLQRIVHPKNIEKWLSDLLQASPQSNGSSRVVSHGSPRTPGSLSPVRSPVDETTLRPKVSAVAKNLSESFNLEVNEDYQFGRVGPVVMPDTYAVHGIQCVGVPVAVTLPIRNAGIKWIKATLAVQMPDSTPVGCCSPWMSYHCIVGISFSAF